MQIHDRHVGGSREVFEGEQSIEPEDKGIQMFGVGYAVKCGELILVEVQHYQVAQAAKGVILDVLQAVFGDRQVGELP
jgi:hypothetical protein